MLNVKLCTGCTACKSICPKQAIDMISESLEKACTSENELEKMIENLELTK